VTVGSLATTRDLPSKRDEAWRYAPHRTLADLVFGPAVESRPAELGDILERIPAMPGCRFVIVNGVVDAELSRVASDDGATVSTMADAIAQRSPLMARHVGIDEAADAFVSLNVQFGVDGAVIDVAPDTTLATPIHVVDVTVPDLERNTSCSGVVVHLGARSSATLVETRIGEGEGFGGSNVRTSVVLDHGATLEHVVVQDLPTSQVHLGRVDVVQSAESTYRSSCFNLGSMYGRLACYIRLEGPGALADLSGLFFGSGDQTLDQQVTVIHAAENCTSRQSFRGVLDDRSVGVFNGGIEVRPGADGSDAAQANDNLVLSDRAEVNTQPRLEILADEVSCTHGTTVGQLDDTALYYLRSRGIAAKEARRLLVDAFADQVVDGVGIESVRSWIVERIGHGGHG